MCLRERDKYESRERQRQSETDLPEDRVEYVGQVPGEDVQEAEHWGHQLVVQTHCNREGTLVLHCKSITYISTITTEKQTTSQQFCII